MRTSKLLTYAKPRPPFAFDASAIRARYVARQGFTWPGGYELFGVLSDGAILCYRCCESEANNVRGADARSGWRVDAVGCAANMEEGETCGHCSRWVGPEAE